MLVSSCALIATPPKLKMTLPTKTGSASGVKASAVILVASASWKRQANSHLRFPMQTALAASVVILVAVVRRERQRVLGLRHLDVFEVGTHQQLELLQFFCAHLVQAVSQAVLYP